MHPNRNCMKRLLALMFSALCISSAACTQAEHMKATGNAINDSVPSYRIVESNKVSAPDWEDMRAVAENDYLVLYLRDNTAEIAVLNKKNGRMWYSNPVDAESDSIASNEVIEQLRSQFLLTYYDSSATISSLNSYNESVMKGNFDIDTVEDGVKITYRLEKKEKAYLFPEIISEERMEQFCANLDESDADELKRRRYMFVSLADAQTDEERKSLQEMYPTLSENNNLYVARETNNESIKERISELFASAGYTEEDLVFDRNQNKVKLDQADNYRFVIPLVYKLEGENLLAYIPGTEIEYNKSFPISTITLLPFLGAAPKGKNGYIFVPDGSGALIYFDNGKLKAQDYTGKVYGSDYSILEAVKNPVPYPVTMPVFGSNQGDCGFFAVIEYGESFATVEASISGKSHSYNTVYTTFEVLPSTNLALGQLMNTQDKLMAFAPGIDEGGFGVRYFFLEDDPSFSAMARCYRDFLESRGVLTRTDEKDPPFILETVGSISKKKLFLGIPYDGNVTLTDFEETRMIVQRVLDAGVSQPVLRLSGWMNKGMNQSVPDRIKVLSALGGRSGLLKLSQDMSQKGVRLYPNISFQYAYSGLFASQKPYVRGLDSAVMKKYQYNPITSRIDKDLPAPYILSPSLYVIYAENSAGFATKYGFAGVSVGTLGSELNSDFNKKSDVTRQEALKFSAQAIASLNEHGLGVLCENSGAYAWAGTNYMVNLPQASNSRYVCDESVPFLQMVLHGAVSYAGSPANLSGDLQTDLLKAVETGSGMYVQWIYRDNSLVKETYYDYLYAAQVDYSFERVVSAYKTIKEALSGLNTVRIQSWEKLSPQVTQTVYENGVKVYVNYGDTAYEASGVRVEARNFAVIGNS